MDVGTQTPSEFFKISSYPLIHAYSIQLYELEQQLCKRKLMEKTDISDPQLEHNPKKIQLGPNGTRLSKDMYRRVDYSCYKRATRDLCYMVFGRETLGTHTLTGRAGPGAVMYNMKPKAQLPWQQVEDILHHITTKFNVLQAPIVDEIRRACRNAYLSLKAKKLKE